MTLCYNLLFLLLFDDLKIYRGVKSAEDSNSVQEFNDTKFCELRIHETIIICFIRKTKVLVLFSI